MPLKRHLSFIFIIAASVLGIYYVTFSNGFVFDDNDFIVKNESIRKLDAESVASYFTDRNTVSASEDLSKDVWRPLVTLSFAIDYRLWKLDPRFYHVENALLHAANAALLYIFIFLVTGSSFGAFITALVFAVHPAQVEAVTWVSGRANLLFLFFFLLSFIFHVSARRYGRGGYCHAISVALFACSLLSKEMAITLPLMLILYDAHYSEKKRLASHAAYYGPYLAIAFFYLFARLSLLGVLAQKGSWWGGSLSGNILVMLVALLQYIRLLFLPVNLNSSYLLDIPKSIWDGQVVASILVLSVIGCIYYVFRRVRDVSFFVLWFFVALLPVSNIVPIKAVMAERFLYLPLIGYAAVYGIVFSVLEEVFRQRPALKKAAVFILTFFLSAYGLLTVARNLEWKDEITYYTMDAARSPGNAKPHYNLGYAYMREAERNKGDTVMLRSYYLLAAREYRAASAISPLAPFPYAGLGYLMPELGDYGAAIKNLRKASALKEDADVYNNLAAAYYRQGAYGDAFNACRKALSMSPRHAKACVNLGNVYFAKGEFAKARRIWARAVESGYADEDLERKMDYLKGEGY